MWPIYRTAIEVDDKASGREKSTPSDGLQCNILSLWHLIIGLSYGTAQQVVVQVLHYRSISTRRVLRAFTDNTAAEPMAYLRFLQHYTLGGHT